MSGELEKIRVKGTEASKEPDFPGYVIGEKGAPGLVVLQEWWGIDFEIKKQAKIVASNGYRVLVPDLYRGKLGADVEEAHHLMDNLDWSNAVEDITACARHLLQEGSPKVGAVGFCMGGALSAVAAIRVPEISAAVVFYGTPNPQLADAATCQKPVQAHFGEKDEMKGFSAPEDAKAFEEKLKKAGCTYEFHNYPGQGHAFLNQSPEAVKRKKAMDLPEHDQRTVDLAWSRTFAWFDKYVKGNV